jgi:general secretion pathway protein F
VILGHACLLKATAKPEFTDAFADVSAVLLDIRGTNPLCRCILTPLSLRASPHVLTQKRPEGNEPRNNRNTRKNEKGRSRTGKMPIPPQEWTELRGCKQDLWLIASGSTVCGMGLFQATLLTDAGRKSVVTIEAGSMDAALRELRRQGRRVLDVQPMSRQGRRGRGITFKGGFDAAEFADRLVPLVKAHVSLESALESLARNPRNPYEAEVVNELRNGLHEGERFSDLVRRRDDAFPGVFAELVAAGEEADALPAVLEDVKEHLDRQKELKNFLISASIYPLVVFGASVVVMLVLLGLVVPRFAAVIQGTGIEQGVMLKVLLALSGFVSGYWWLLPLAFVAGLLILSATRKNKSVQEWLGRVVLGFPLIGRIVRDTEYARFSRTLSVLLAHSVRLDRALEIAPKVVQSPPLRESLSPVRLEVSRGLSLAEGLNTVRECPDILIQMVQVGERTGELAEVLAGVGERLGSQARQSLKRLMTLFEPAVIIVLGLVVGAVVFAMLSAILAIQSGV